MPAICKILRNRDGEIEEVKDHLGKDSQLYKDILSDVKDKELALKMWAIPYSANFIRKFGDWKNDYSLFSREGERYYQQGEPTWETIKSLIFPIDAMKGDKDFRKSLLGIVSSRVSAAYDKFSKDPSYEDNFKAIFGLNDPDISSDIDLLNNVSAKEGETWEIGKNYNADSAKFFLHFASELSKSNPDYRTKLIPSLTRPISDNISAKESLSNQKQFIDTFKSIINKVSNYMKDEDFFSSFEERQQYGLMDADKKADYILSKKIDFASNVIDEILKGNTDKYLSDPNLIKAVNEFSSLSEKMLNYHFGDELNKARIEFQKNKPSVEERIPEEYIPAYKKIKGSVPEDTAVRYFNEEPPRGKEKFFKLNKDGKLNLKTKSSSEIKTVNLEQAQAAFHKTLLDILSKAGVPIRVLDSPRAQGAFDSTKFIIYLRGIKEYDYSALPEEFIHAITESLGNIQHPIISEIANYVATLVDKYGAYENEMKPYLKMVGMEGMSLRDAVMLDEYLLKEVTDKFITDVLYNRYVDPNHPVYRFKEEEEFKSIVQKIIDFFSEIVRKIKEFFFSKDETDIKKEYDPFDLAVEFVDRIMQGDNEIIQSLSQVAKERREGAKTEKQQIALNELLTTGYISKNKPEVDGIRKLMGDMSRTVRYGVMADDSVGAVIFATPEEYANVVNNIDDIFSKDMRLSLFAGISAFKTQEVDVKNVGLKRFDLYILRGISGKKRGSRIIDFDPINKTAKIENANGEEEMIGGEEVYNRLFKISLITTSGKPDETFKRALKLGELGGIEIGGNRIYFSLNPEEDPIEKSKEEVNNVYEKIKQISDSIEIAFDPVTKRNRYRIKGSDKFIQHRVTETLDNTPEEFKPDDNEITTYKKSIGTHFHKMQEEIIKSFIKPDGSLDTDAINEAYNILSSFTPYEIEDNPNYKRLKSALLDKGDVDLMVKAEGFRNLFEYSVRMLQTLPEGTKVASELKITDGKNTAGTIDFLAIIPNPKTGYKIRILDWKFLEKKAGQFAVDVRTKLKYQKQIETYKDLLKTSLPDIKERNFEQTRFVPFPIVYEYPYIQEGDKARTAIRLKELKVGKANPFLETNVELVPYPTLSERTSSSPMMNELISRFTSVMENLIGTTEAIPERDTERKKLIANIAEAIRFMQTKRDMSKVLEIGQKFFQMAAQVGAQMSNLLKSEYNEFDERDLTDVEKQKVISDLAYKAHFLIHILEIYRDFSVFMPKLQQQLSSLEDFSELSEEDINTILSNIDTVVKNAESFSSEASSNIVTLTSVANKFADRFIAKSRNAMTDLLSVEKEITFVTKNLSFISTGTIASVDTVREMATEAENYYKFKTDEFGEKLRKIADSIREMAKSTGVKAFDLYDRLFEKDSKGRRIHKLLYQYKREFYEKAREALQKKDVNWIKDNIDVDKYLEALREKRQKEIKAIEDYYVNITDPAILENKDRELRYVNDKYGTDNDPNFLVNELVYKFPTEKWRNEKYLELLRPENKPLLDMYNLIRELNQIAHESGYLSHYSYENFLPFISATLIDKLVTGSRIRLADDIAKAISISDEDIGYGNKADVNGEVLKSIPRYFTKDKGIPVYDENGRIDHIDYSNMSMDIPRIIYAYASQVFRYQYLSAIEGQVKLLMDVERNKKVIQTNAFGNIKVKRKGGSAEDDFYTYVSTANYDFLRRVVNALIYGELEATEKDIALGKIANKIAKVANNSMGFELIPSMDEKRTVSAAKIINMANRYYNLKTLGFNIPVSITSFMSGNFHAMINANRWFTVKEFIKFESMIFGAKFMGEKGRKMLAALDYFMPYIEHSEREHEKEYATYKIGRLDPARLLMWTMKKGDRILQAAMSLSMLQNYMYDAKSKKFVNIKDYVGKEMGYYAKMYDKSLSLEERKKAQAEFEKKVAEMKETHSVFNQIKIDPNTEKAEIEGVERFSQAVVDFRDMMQNVIRRAQGHLVGTDLNGLRLSVIGRSMMMFKNWIPRALYQRFTDFHYDVGIDNYEWGRIRMFAKILLSEGIKVYKSLGKIISMYKLTDSGLEELEKLYTLKKQQYEESTGKEFKISKEDFYELVRNNLKSTLKEAIILTGLIGMFFAALSTFDYKDEEDPQVKGFYKFGNKMAERALETLMFFYNPNTVKHILAGSMFPSVNVITDMTNILYHSARLGFGYIIGDEEIIDKEHVAKYVLNSIVFLKELEVYMALLYPEWAKEMGIIITPHVYRG